MSPVDEVTNSEQIFRVLDEFGVRYLVIGGVAAALYGSPYPTEDLDICPDRKTENLIALSAALRELEAREWEPHKDDFIDREWSPELLDADEKWLLITKFGPLDLLLAPAGTRGYWDLVRRRAVMDIGGIQVPVVALTDLIRMKESTGRDRDHLHLPTLRKLLDRTWD